MTALLPPPVGVTPQTLTGVPWRGEPVQAPPRGVGGGGGGAAAGGGAWRTRGRHHPPAGENGSVCKRPRRASTGVAGGWWGRRSPLAVSVVQTEQGSPPPGPRADEHL